MALPTFVPSFLFWLPPWPLSTSNTNSAMKFQKFPSGCDDRPRDPYDQLRWARKELEVAREAHERVIIAGHVPPGNKVGSNNFCSQHLLDLEDSLVKKIWETSHVCVCCFLCFLRVVYFTSSKSLATSHPKGLQKISSLSLSAKMTISGVFSQPSMIFLFKTH